MRVAHTTAEMRRQLKTLRGNNTIAFVPTMGCLHDGHISLIKEAKALADIVVVSIYVNPLQFGPNEDLETYPRPFERDAQMCEEAGVDFIFHPTSLYPKSGPKVTLKATKLSDCLCGSDRPGHFDGVVTVVNILFNIIRPDFAIFGEKDWQQLAIIRRMVNDLQIPIEIIGVNIVREADGLAMSSRNRYLSETDRQQALALSQALIAMQTLAAQGENNIETLKAAAQEILTAANITTQYLDVRNATSLKSKRKLNHLSSRAFIAAQVGSARLIDNMPLTYTPLEPTS
ncbi:pantoate--beta-alanine ligase [Mariprofundus sp. EBB-1]|uniref:pantoate--beta-alanine ligase n=1 Tax=Mariprofundus sp. EBB-1 TaxID=2650971 RepID=UPI000EF2453A|nr:pantoate--beta-alanine ligase [Mariprofundus sp. EBB-1]RLL51936.1 pantoate--beta-alanine ligase [Mariprofundus sp. EBB-1]